MTRTSCKWPRAFNKGMCEDVTALNYATEHGMEIDHSHETGEIRCITRCNNSLLGGVGCITFCGT